MISFAQCFFFFAKLTRASVLHSLHHADRVIVLDDGVCTHMGTFEEVKSQGAVFALAARKASEDEVEDTSTKESGFEVDNADEMEETNEELLWKKDQASKLGVYRFFFQQAGWRGMAMVGCLMVTYEAIQMGLSGYLKRT